MRKILLLIPLFILGCAVEVEEPSQKPPEKDMERYLDYPSGNNRDDVTNGQGSDGWMKNPASDPPMDDSDNSAPDMDSIPGWLKEKVNPFPGLPPIPPPPK